MFAGLTEETDENPGGDEPSGQCCNTHAIATYIRVAPSYGHSVTIYGAGYGFAPELQFSTDVERFDRVLYLYESERHRISPLQEAAILAKFPRRHRLILDVDGMYNPVVNIDGYDFNHRSEADHVQWINYIDAVGEKVMQPTLACSANPRVSPLTFYGYDQTLQVDPLKAPPKRYDMLHVGHNNRRWRQVSAELLPAIEQIRDQLVRSDSSDGGGTHLTGMSSGVCGFTHRHLCCTTT